MLNDAIDEPTLQYPFALSLLLDTNIHNSLIIMVSIICKENKRNQANCLRLVSNFVERMFFNLDDDVTALSLYGVIRGEIVGLRYYKGTVGKKQASFSLCSSNFESVAWSLCSFCVVTKMISIAFIQASDWQHPKIKQWLSYYLQLLVVSV